MMAFECRRVVTGNTVDGKSSVLYDSSLALVEQDSAKRTALLDGMQDLLAQDLAVVPALETQLLYAEAANIQGLTLHPSQILIWKYLHQ